MIPRPPISTLFPYTTLFRSQKQGAVAVIIYNIMPNSQEWLAGLEEAAVDIPIAIISTKDGRWIEKQDRKSTRLNSSHVAISYAVFCLKKKKNKQTTHAITRN